MMRLTGTCGRIPFSQSLFAHHRGFVHRQPVEVNRPAIVASSAVGSATETKVPVISYVEHVMLRRGIQVNARICPRFIYKGEKFGAVITYDVIWLFT
jgi:hypothetical protein